MLHLPAHGHPRPDRARPPEPALRHRRPRRHDPDRDVPLGHPAAHRRDPRGPAPRRHGAPGRRRRPPPQQAGTPADRHAGGAGPGATQRHHLRRRLPAVARTRALPRQPGRAAPEVLRHRHRRRAVVHDVLGQPRGPAVPPVQLVHQDRRPGPLRLRRGVLLPDGGAEPDGRRRAVGRPPQGVEERVGDRGRLPQPQRPAALDAEGHLLHARRPGRLGDVRGDPARGRTRRAGAALRPGLPGRGSSPRATRWRTGCSASCPAATSRTGRSAPC